jgi:hypothetical protein
MVKDVRHRQTQTVVGNANLMIKPLDTFRVQTCKSKINGNKKIFTQRGFNSNNLLKCKCSNQCEGMECKRTSFRGLGIGYSHHLAL